MKIIENPPEGSTIEWLHFFSDNFYHVESCSCYIPGAYFGRGVMRQDGFVYSVNYKRGEPLFVEFFEGYIQAWQPWERINEQEVSLCF